jgi:hypothetical protein
MKTTIGIVTMKLRTRVRGGGLPSNHNQAPAMKLRTRVRGGGLPSNHNLNLKTGHQETLT